VRGSAWRTRGGTTISPRGTEKGGEAGEGGAMVLSGFAAFTLANRTKSSVSPWRAVRPAILGDRLTRREAGAERR
jgi:hypothetical protein